MEAADLPLSTHRTVHPAWRELLSFNVIWAVVLAIVGYIVGHALGNTIAQHSAAELNPGGSDQEDIAVLLGMLGSIVGWIGGLGFFNYPLKRIAGRAPSLHEGEEQGMWRYFKLCTDHKVVAMQYLVGTLFFLSLIHI